MWAPNLTNEFKGGGRPAHLDVGRAQLDLRDSSHSTIVHGPLCGHRDLRAQRSLMGHSLNLSRLARMDVLRSVRSSQTMYPGKSTRAVATFPPGHDARLSTGVGRVADLFGFGSDPPVRIR